MLLFRAFRGPDFDVDETVRFAALLIRPGDVTRRNWINPLEERRIDPRDLRAEGMLYRVSVRFGRYAIDGQQRLVLAGKQQSPARLCEIERFGPKEISSDHQLIARLVPDNGHEVTAEVLEPVDPRLSEHLKEHIRGHIGVFPLWVERQSRTDWRFLEGCR